MAALAIIWHHVCACRRDLRARRLGDLTIARGHGGQVFIGNDTQEWRLK